MTVKVNFSHHDKTRNIKTIHTKQNGCHRFPFIIMKNFTNYIVPADIQFIKLFTL